MQEVAEIILKVQQESSYLYKQSILQRNASNKLLREILRFIYNPYFKTNISWSKLQKAPYYSGYPVPQDPLEIMQYLRENPTGDKETCGVVNTWMCTRKTPNERWLAEALITQDLQIGVNTATLNKVFGADFIPKLGCMLGTPIDKIPQSKQAWPYIVTEKLDGVRRILVKQNGNIRMFSRSGHEDFGLVDIIKEAKALPDNYAYDGELLAEGSFTDSIAQRQATNSLANKKGERRGLTFNIFDMVPVNDFLSGCSLIPAIERKLKLAAVLNDDSGASLVAEEEQFTQLEIAYSDFANHKVIKSVPILAVASSMEDIEPIVNHLWNAGREGVMLNDIKAPYESKRVKSLVKMKKTETYVLRVEGFTEGSGKNEGSLGALITEYKDCYLQVGSGFTDYERYDIWTNQDKYKGMLFEVEAFGESTNKQGLVSLNCPIFKRFL